MTFHDVDLATQSTLNGEINRVASPPTTDEMIDADTRRTLFSTAFTTIPTGGLIHFCLNEIVRRTAGPR